MEADLRLIEETFKERLVDGLRVCAAGRWGLFGSNDAVLVAHFGKHARYLSPVAAALVHQAAEIEELRTRLGCTEPNLWVERFKAYRKRSTEPNAPGEPKLAQALLDEMRIFGG
ncbi:MAG TPA: hypothetical protein VFE16_10630 [Candidatus Cybelea sp.]|nr:hypothetical protein [Candidatus Cybelea sp.]